MYSVVLMMALSGSTDLPAWGKGGGCYGGCGGGRGSCTGWGGFRGKHRHGGSGYYGCSGSYGCSGYVNACGCCGAVAAPAPSVPATPPAPPPEGGTLPPAPPEGAKEELKTPPAATGGDLSPEEQKQLDELKGLVDDPNAKAKIDADFRAKTPAERKAYYEQNKKKEGALLSAPAHIVVTLPAAAALTFDGTATNSTSAERTFATPQLASGKVYVYTVAAVVERDGQKLTESRTIRVRAGETTRVQLDFPAVVAQK
jgi:uncharacterized protein (TIGR03000 family)